uniref:Stc1 domain-containing protein n=1 Tax=Fusarium oxysporum (strain Fo5176) TaxID=660025 RepID=A0A0D2YBY5_FUSOF
MPSNDNKGGYKPFRCASGNEWKPLNMFSKAQQRNTRFLIDSGRKVDPENTGMICKEHNSTPALEHGCVGCDRTLPYDAFSLNQRRLEDWRCLQCVAWDTVAEPSVVPIPKATGHVSVEEEEMMSQGYLAPVEVAQFFDEDDLPGVSNRHKEIERNQ